MHVSAQVIKSMLHSPVHNYVIPGLTSWLVGGMPVAGKGCVRVFTMDRVHEENIIPHSHRFDFQCLVLSGTVTNRIWVESNDGDPYQVSDVTYEGEFGVHRHTPLRVGRFKCQQNTYPEAHWYGMTAKQFHSIYFSKGSMVLFMEGAPTQETSQVLEPIINGKVIPLFKTEPWMFQHE